MTFNTTNLVEIASPLGFDATVERLVQAIQAAGLSIVARLDHSGDARAAGLDLPPTLVLVYGHPRGGTPIMQAVPSAALDLPLRVLVREALPTRTVVAFHPIAEMLAAAGVAPEIARRLEPAQQLLRTALDA